MTFGGCSDSGGWSNVKRFFFIFFRNIVTDFASRMQSQVILMDSLDLTMHD